MDISTNNKSQSSAGFDQKRSHFELFLSQLEEFGYKATSSIFKHDDKPSSIVFSHSNFAFGAYLVLQKMGIVCECKDKEVLVSTYEPTTLLKYFKDCRLRHKTVLELVKSNVRATEIITCGDEPNSPQAYIDFKTSHARDKAKKLLEEHGFVNMKHGRGTYSIVVYYITVEKTTKYCAAMEAVNPGYLTERLKRYTEAAVGKYITVSTKASKHRNYITISDLPTGTLDKLVQYLQDVGGYNVKVGNTTISVSKIPIKDSVPYPPSTLKGIKRGKRDKSGTANEGDKVVVPKEQKPEPPVVKKNLVSPEGLALLIERFGGDEAVAKLLAVLSKALPEADPKLIKAMELLNNGAFIIVPDGDTFDFALPGGVGTMKIPYAAIKGAIKKAGL